MLPAYMRYDCATDQWREIKPRELPLTNYPAAHFGDDWNEKLDGTDVTLATRYFRAIAHLADHFDYVNLRVGGQDNVIKLSERKYQRGVTFEAPRQSLMTALRYEVFDDLLIANFMKTTLHGDWGPSRLYPDFSPYVAKYADNGRAKSKAELQAYLKSYRNRAILDFLKWQFEKKAEKIYRQYVAEDSVAHRLAKQAYRYYKKRVR